MVRNVISIGQKYCPICGGELRYYDRVSRIVRTKGRKTTYIWLRRFRCFGCESVHREIPSNIHPYKQYEAELISGVLEGLITQDTLGYEDYPCEATMNKWIREIYRLYNEETIT